MKLLFVITFLIFSFIAHTQNNQETLTNQTIIQLHKVGLGTEVIKSKIQTSHCSFDLSTDGLITLKKEGISDDIINSMLSKQSGAQVNVNVQPDNKNTTITLNSGIYYYDTTKNNYIELDPSILTNEKSGGLGETLKRSLSGLFNSKQRVSLSGSEAQMKLHDSKPIFLFVFDTTVNGFSNSNTFWSSAQSPNEFFLIKLNVVKNSREVIVGKGNTVSSNIGIDDQLKMPFLSRKLRKGVYQVTPSTNIISGEYCFMFAASSMSGGQSHKVFDFSIKN